MSGVEHHPEDVRNRLLRRVDWRFLLPAPNPGRTACFAPGLLADGVRAVASEVFDDRHPPEAASCELAVVADPRRATLRAAWRALAPGGTLYGEWRAPLGASPRALERMLAREGFDRIRCYAARPDPARAPAAFWIPLHSEPAIDYFLSGQGAPAPFLPRVGRAVRARLWRAGPRFRISSPICVVARKPDAVPPGDSAVERPADAAAAQRAGRADFHAELMATLAAGWREWSLGSPPQQLDLLLLTRGQSSLNKLVALVFEPSQSLPRLVVKMARVADSVAPLAREAEALAAIHAGGTPVEGAPQRLFWRPHAGVMTLGQTAVAGRLVSESLEPESFRALALQATDWLLRLPRRAPARTRDEQWSQVVGPALAEFERGFGAVTSVAELSETAATLAALPALPVVSEQRDFSPWNVLVGRDGGLAVLDWESALVDGLPAMDLLYFLTYCAFYLRGAFASGAYEAAYREVWDSATPLGRVADECLGRYCGALALPRSSIGPLRLLAWLVHSRSEHRQATAAGAAPPAAETLRRSLFFRLWREELARCAHSVGLAEVCA